MIPRAEKSTFKGAPQQTMNANLTISATEADWQRERITAGRYEPWKRLLQTIRSYQSLEEHVLASLLKPVTVCRYRFWSAVCGADIPLNTVIGGGLILTHPNGVVIHPQSRIGVNCLIFQQVTIGVGTKPGLPVIGGHVDIGAGAKILGGISIGDHAKIGANSVVLDDVPAGATAVGIPARIISRDLP